MQRITTVALASLASIVTPGSVVAQTIGGEIFYTRYRTTANDRFVVKKATYVYDGARFAITGKAGIARNVGADGLAFSPRGTLLVAGQNRRQLCELNAQSGQRIACSSQAATNLYHVTIDNSNKKLFSSAQPGNLISEFPIDPRLGAPKTHRLRGGATLTQIIFDNVGRAFFTRSRPNGRDSSFGTLDTGTWTATNRITGLDGFHGGHYDSYTGHVLTFGSKWVTQIDVSTMPPKIVARLDITTLPSRPRPTGPIDQGSSDGRGLIFVAVNGTTLPGQLIFLDIRKSKRVDRPDFSATPALDTYLDDIAPLSGPGCGASAAAVEYGNGWRGRNGVPALTATAPRVGRPFQLSIANSSGTPTHACIALSLDPASVPTPFGGTLLVGRFLAFNGFTLPANGQRATFLAPPDACGMRLYLQSFQADGAATHGIAFSRGLRLRVGL